MLSKKKKKRKGNKAAAHNKNHSVNHSFSRHKITRGAVRSKLESRCTSALWGLLDSSSQSDASTVVLELAGKNAAVQLVKLHQLDQISKPRVVIVQTVEQLSFIVHW